MRTFTQLLLATNLLLLASVSDAGTVIDESRPMSADGVVDLDLTNAIIRISGTDSNEFHIVGELGDQVDKFALLDVEGNIHFTEEWRPRGSRNWEWGDRNSFDFGCWFGNDDEECQDAGRYFSRLEVQVPHGAVLRLNGTNGDVMISDMTNNTNIDVVNASVLLSKLTGTVRAETVNGSLDADNLRGRVSLQTVNGDITDTDSSADRVDYSVVNGDIDSNTSSEDVSAEAVNGDIAFKLVTVRDLHVTTVGGRIEVDTALASDANVEISTVSGSVGLTVPEATSARFRVHTRGRINNTLSDDQSVRQSRYANSNNLNFSTNGGVADVDINAVSGNVTLRSK